MKWKLLCFNLQVLRAVAKEQYKHKQGFFEKENKFQQRRWTSKKLLIISSKYSYPKELGQVIKFYVGVWSFLQPKSVTGIHRQSKKYFHCKVVDFSGVIWKLKKLQNKWKFFTGFDTKHQFWFGIWVSNDDENVKKILNRKLKVQEILGC